MSRLVLCATFGAFSLASCATYAPRGYTIDPGTFGFVLSSILAVALYLLHYRAQRAEIAAEEAGDRIRWRFTRHATGLKLAEQRAESHGLQLKGAGERIRKLEAELAGTQRTVDELLQRPAEGASLDLAARTAVKNLRTEVFGGSLGPSGLTKIGELTQLRQQVEGINSNLGNRVVLMEKREQTAFRVIAEGAARLAVRTELERREKERRSRPWWRRVFGR